MTVQTACDLAQYKLYIDGQWCDPDSGETFVSENPAIGAGWADIADGRAGDIDRAVAAARRAFDKDGWPDLIPQERAKLLRRLADLCLERGPEIAKLEATDNGKLITEMMLQWRLIHELLLYWAGMTDKIDGRMIPSPLPLDVRGTHLPNCFAYTRREPVGVVGAITPWNSPAMQIAYKFGPAMAAGCTMVCKPSEHAPVSTLEFTRLVDEAGFPPGVFNTVPSSRKDVGAHLAAHRDVDKVSFTGSTAVGQSIVRASADNMKRVTCELGGKSASIVFADADIEKAVTGVMAGIFAATGQTCMAGSRVLVEDPIYDRFVAALAEAARGMKVGDPLDPGTQMGPIANRPNYEKVLSYFEIAKQEGVQAAAGGSAHELGGYFVHPTVFAGVTNQMRVAREEIFGPVASVIRFNGEEEAIAIANDTDYGLAGGVFTESIPKAHRVAAKVRAGTVWINTYRLVTHMAPFGGYKMSGWGRENSLEGLDAFLETKAVWVPVE
ncbi:MAG: aldehyde dehydrogenase [Hyphomonas sp.]|nr:aldehyde dehydrogenase [Hyphomonas sp.]